MNDTPSSGFGFMATRLPHTSPDTRVSAAMNALLRDVGGWSQLSASLARWLLALKGKGMARLWVESVFSNMGKMK